MEEDFKDVIFKDKPIVAVIDYDQYAGLKYKEVN